MSMEVGRIDLGLDVNQKAFNKQLSGISRGATKQVKGAFGGLGAKIGVAIGAAAVISFTKSCLELGSNLAEVQNVVDTVFPSMNNQVNSFAKNAMNQFGLSETVTKKYMGTLGAMSKSMGFTEGASYNMAKAVTGLAGDVASFYNMSSDEAYTKLKSIWTGETESLKEIGVIMTQTNLDQYALNNGFGKTTAKMTEQEKTMLRYKYVMSSLSAAQGDFAKTSGSWANQVRVLGLQFSSLKATIGQGLINLFTPIIKVINILLGKLQTLANAFLAFTQLITGKKAVASNPLGGIASDAASATSATDGLSDSTAGVGNAAIKAAKQIKRSLAGFDQVNQLSGDSSDSGASGGSSGAGGTIDTGAGLMGDTAAATDQSSQKMTKALDAVITKAKDLKDLFLTGFSLGFDKASFKPILKSISSIKTSLKDIFTSSEVLGAADSWVDTIALSLGRTTGSMASIGITLADLILGSISKYFEQNKDFIKGKIVEMFNLSADTATIYANFIEVFDDIFSVFKSPAAKQIGADLIAIFVNSSLSIITLFQQLGNDIMKAVLKPFEENKDAIKEAIGKQLKIDSSIISSIKGVFEDTFDSLQTAYDKYIGPAIDKIGSGLSTVFEALLSTYNSYIAPVLEKLAAKFNDLCKGPLKSLIDAVLTFVGTVVDSVAEIWDKTLAPLIAWVVKTFGPSWAKTLSDIGTNIMNTATVIMNIATGLIKALTGITTFLTGVFTLNWSKAWSGIKMTFSGIIDAIKAIISPIGKFFGDKFGDAWNAVKAVFSIKTIREYFGTVWDTISSVFTSIGKNMGSAVSGAFKSVMNSALNSIESKINGFIDLLNSARKIINKIPGVSIGNISRINIPALAEGGYVKANAPQLAMIGDNKREGEVVAPESKLRQLAIEAVRMAGGSGGLTEEALYRVMARVFREYMHFYIGDEDLAKHVNRGYEMMDLRFSPVKGGV